MQERAAQVQRVEDEVVDIVTEVAEQTSAAAEALAEDTAQAIDEVVDGVTDAEEGRVSRFTAFGMTLVAEEYGRGEPVFVLVHGIGMGRGVFVSMIDELSEHGRVIAIDQPGYGEAPEPPRTPTMARTADLVAAFIRDRRLGRPVLIGHSMGTQVVTEVAARHPADAGPIVLVAPTVDRTARSAPVQLLRLGRDLLDESPKVLFLGGREYLRAGPNLSRKMKAMLEHRPEDAYPRVRSRALVMRGEDDRVSPARWCAEVAGMLPDAETAEIPGHGHETLISDARPAAESILGWLARRS